MSKAWLLNLTLGWVGHTGQAPCPLQSYRVGNELRSNRHGLHLMFDFICALGIIDCCNCFIRMLSLVSLIYGAFKQLLNLKLVVTILGTKLLLMGICLSDKCKLIDKYCLIYYTF